MIKKTVCLLCVFLMLFLVSCKKEEEAKTTETTTEIITEEVRKTTTPSTTEAEPETEKTGKQNKYSLTNTRRTALSDKQYDAYKIIVNGLDEGKTEISVDLTTEVNSYNKVKSALWSGYPLYALVQDMNYSHDKKILSVIYSKSGDDLKNTIEAFYKKVDKVLTKDILSADDFSKALLLYDYISDGAPSNDATLTVYDMIMNGTGTSIQFSMAYEYFLSLAGVEANHVSSDDGEVGPIALTQVKLGNNYYYMSPYHEAADNGGKYLKFFGLTDERAKSSTGANNFFSIDNEYNQVKVPACSDDTFSFTEFLESWTLDSDKKELNYKMTDRTYTYKF